MDGWVRFPTVNLLLMLMLEGIVSISGGTGVQPFLSLSLSLSSPPPLTMNYVRE